MPSGTAARVEVLHGFEAGMACSRGLLHGARHVGGLVSSTAAEEFLPGLIPEVRPIRGRGGDVRMLAVGEVLPDLVPLCAEVGVDLRIVSEAREVGFLLSDVEAMVWPLEQPRQSALQEVALHVRDPPFLAHLWLAFERAWGKAAPPA